MPASTQHTSGDLGFSLLSLSLWLTSHFVFLFLLSPWGFEGMGREGRASQQPSVLVFTYLFLMRRDKKEVRMCEPCAQILDGHSDQMTLNGGAFIKLAGTGGGGGGHNTKHPNVIKSAVEGVGGGTGKKKD